MEAKKGRRDISVLSHELLVEILSRVGRVKYALRCKLVCKLWCSLVVDDTDSYWLRRWYEINGRGEDVALFTTYKGSDNSEPQLRSIDCDDSIAMKLDFLPCNPVCVLDSHKDLLLCSDHSCYYICNPLTRQWAALPPPPPGLRGREATKEEEIRFNQLSKVKFTVSGGRLAVVRMVPFQLMVRELEPEERKIRIWVLRSGCKWIEVDDGDILDLFEDMRYCKKIVSYKGKLIWLAEQKQSVDVDLLSCDLDSNRYARLPLTPGFPAKIHGITLYKTAIGVCHGGLRLALLNGCLKLSVWEFDDQRHDWDMMRELDLRETGESSRDWVKLVSIHRRSFSVEAMSFHPTDRDILYMVVTMSGGTGRRDWTSHLFSCNLRKTELELVRTFPVYAARPKIFHLVQQSWPTPVPKVISELMVEQ